MIGLTSDDTICVCRLQTDRATLVLSKIINKISAIKGSRYGKPTFVAADVEAGELQSLFGQYLREKGAAKVSSSFNLDSCRSFSPILHNQHSAL